MKLRQQMGAGLAKMGRWVAGPFRAQAYDAATQGRQGRNWSSSSGGPNRVLNMALGLLRNRARQAYRNNPWIERSVERNVTNEVGIGMTPMFISTDKAFNEGAALWWPRWVKQATADGALGFYGALAQMARTRRVAGEVFIRRRPRPAAWGLSVPFQIQVIEPDLVPLTLNERRPNGNRIVAGKEYDRAGRFVALWMYPEHPGDGEYTGGNLVRVLARDVIHHYLPIRPGQVRGEPDMVQALLRAKQYDSYDHAELERKETRAPFTGFLQKTYAGEKDWTLDPITGEEIRPDDDGFAEINAAPGTIISGAPGESLTLFDGDNTGGGYADYQRQQLLAIAAGAKSLYELTTGDYSKVNDRTYRAMIGEYRREIEMAQQHLCIHQVCERVADWFTDTAVMVGVLPVTHYATNRADYTTRRWSPHRFKHIHPTQDIAAIKAELELDLASLDDENAKRGQRTEEVQRQNVEARARRQALEKDHQLSKDTDA